MRHLSTPVIAAAAAALLVLTGCSTSDGTASVAAPAVSTVLSTVVSTTTVTETVAADAPAPSDEGNTDENTDENTDGAATSEETTENTGPAPDPCALLTQDEASTLAGIPMMEPVTAGPDGAKTLCQYSADPNGPVGQVQVFLGDGVVKSLEIDRDVLSHEFTMPTGIGDEAYLEDGNIFFRKGTQWVQINLVVLSDDALFVEPLQTAAQTIVSRLP